MGSTARTIKEAARYTYSDYYGWETNDRYELIDGVPHLMSPSPTQVHQEILLEIGGQFREFLKGKPCKVFIAPFDVRLNVRHKDDTVVQPDLFVVCDMSKLDGKACNGAPDMVMEILSPTSARMDRAIKLVKYQNAGVLEYWIVDPESKTVSVYLLENGKYNISVYYDADTVPVYVLDGCRIKMQDVFI